MITYAFIDASNLFYGGEKSLGWKIDYKKLIEYLRTKYGVSRVFYFGGIEIHQFNFDYQNAETVPLDQVYIHLEQVIKTQGSNLNEAQLLLISKHLQRVKFYKKLASFGYELFLKPVKTYHQADGSTQRKANCDVEMAFYLMKERDNYDRVVVLSGDGDFLPVLKYLCAENKEVLVLARGPRAAREIREFAAGNFKDFEYLKKILSLEKKV